MKFTSDRQRRAMFSRLNSRGNYCDVKSHVFSRLAGLGGDLQRSCGVLSNRFSEQETDDDRKYIEILKKGGVVHVTPPDSTEEFRKFEKEMRKKLDNKKFAGDPKKTKQAVFGVPFGSDELVADVRVPSKEKEIAAGYRQVYFGKEFREGRTVNNAEKLGEAKSVLDDLEFRVEDYDQSALDEAKASLASGDISKAKKAIDDQIIIHEVFPEDEKTDRLRETSRKLGDIIGSEGRTEDEAAGNVKVGKGKYRVRLRVGPEGDLKWVDLEPEEYDEYLRSKDI